MSVSPDLHCVTVHSSLYSRLIINTYVNSSSLGGGTV